MAWPIVSLPFAEASVLSFPPSGRYLSIEGTAFPFLRHSFLRDTFPTFLGVCLPPMTMTTVISEV